MSKKKIIALIIIYLFASFVVFTVFMGVPIFNVLVGILGCYYLVKRNTNKKVLTYYRIFSFAVLLFVFIGSAIIALTDKYTASNLEGMFNLSFNITNLHIWMIILIGGSIFLYINDFLIRKIYSRYRLTVSDK